MDTNIQIQSLKSQIDNMKLQINNIELQNNNMNMMMGDTINDQLLNLSIQMFNAGIQSFTTGKNLYMSSYPEKFYKQIKNISKQIISFISEYKNSQQQQQQMQQQMMQQQIMQQMMAQQQMMQQQMMAQQMIAQRQMMEQFENELYKFKFKNVSGTEEVEIKINKNSSIRELLNKFKEETLRISIDGYKFLCDGENIGINKERKVEDLFSKEIIFIEKQSGFNDLF